MHSDIWHIYFIIFIFQYDYIPFYITKIYMYFELNPDNVITININVFGNEFDFEL